MKKKNVIINPLKKVYHHQFTLKGTLRISNITQSRDFFSNKNIKAQATLWRAQTQAPTESFRFHLNKKFSKNRIYFF